MRPLALGPLDTPIAVWLAIALLVYMIVTLRAAIRVSGNVWRERIARQRGVVLVSVAWAVDLGAAHLVAQLWANGLAIVAAATG
jgi:multisubunit Na+/H+ antiporter MnhE subunit